MSNRLTFSLASLVFLIALGLIFVPTSVMAHDQDPATDGIQHGTTGSFTTIGAHMHPTITVEVDDVDPRTDGIQVNRKATDASASPAITDLMVVFDVKLKLDSNVPLRAADDSPIAAGTFGANSITALVYNNKNGAVAGISGTPDVAAAYTGEDLEWTTTITITLTDDSDTDTTDVQQLAAALEAGINVDLTAVAGLIEANVVTGDYHDGTGPIANVKSETLKVTVVPPVDTTPPTLTLTKGDPDETTGAVVVTLAFSEAVNKDSIMVTHTPSHSSLADTYTVGPVTAATDVAESFTVTVTPKTATLETGDLEAGEVELSVTAAMDTAGNALAAPVEIDVDLAARAYIDKAPPTVEIIPDPSRKSAAFDIHFTAEDNFSEATDLTTAVAITPATAVTDAAPMAMAQEDGSYMVTVTPVPATVDKTTIDEVTIKVTVTVTDAADNDGDASEFFYLAERTYSDKTAPVLTATVGDADATTGARVVTLTFNEALKAAPTVTDSTAATSAITGRYTVSVVTGSGMEFMVTVTPNALAIGDADFPGGTVTLTVAAMDASDNPLAADNNTVAVALAARAAPTDMTAPTFTHDAPTTPISGATVVTLTFSETVMGVGVTGTPGMDDAKYTDVVAGSGMAYTVTVTPISRDNLAADEGQRVITFVVTGADAAGNKVDGSFSLILAARKETPDQPPVPGNKAPAFAPDAAIADISGTVGMAITAVTLPAATDVDGDTVTYSITDAAGQPAQLPAGLSFNSATRRLSGTPTAAMASTEYIYVASDGKGGTAPLGFSIEVMEITPPAASGDIPGTYADGVTTITSGMIASNGFVTLGAMSLPDLEEFFELGGTIGLSNGDTTDDKNSRTVVISEILWGLDLGAPAMDQTKWQFIELYNTTGDDIDLTGWTLTYTSGNVLPASDIDQMSNRGRNGWDVDSGDTGKSGRVTGTLATDVTSAITPVNIVSMYRNINYAHVKKNTGNRGELVKGIPGGNGKGSWKSSQRRSQYNRWIYDSKRAEHFKATGILSASTVGHHKWFRINEIGNDTGADNDWVELHNMTGETRSLKNYALSVVTEKGKDTKLFDFKDQDWKVGPKGYVVIATGHPRDTDLAAGKDISVADDQEENKGASHLFVVKSVNLPDNGKFAVILRNAHDKQGGGGHLEDVVATSQGAFGDVNLATSLWPLTATGGPHGNVIDHGDEAFKAPAVYQRNGGNGRGEKNFAVIGFTGIGYDRDVNSALAANGGTPGYDNGARKEKIADLSNAEVSFSEIMLGLGDGRTNLPQWIEIYNSSMTQAVNLNGWKLHVENTADVKTALDAVLTLGSMIIPPNQTVLIVTNTGRVSDPDHFPSNRVLNLWTAKAHRDALEMTRRTDQVFSTTGLYLKLTDKDNKLVDAFGNLDGDRRTRDELDDTWAIPMNGADDERRSSLIRVYDDGVAVKGTMEKAWILADKTDLAFAISETYYGDPDDYGTPGFRAGGPLPVSLSKFRPERLDDGSIRIAWVTESELNNAGFNILRSEVRDGEYTQINTKLIAGQGTTSEKTTYEWKDTTAKPTVVYYYQIQDVSLDGKVQTLRQSRLKGNVSPAGKLTTTWGELKALR